jgi:hypothetical protein
MTDHLELIAAFADGEHVDAGELKLALSTDSGREYLIDVLALRRLVEPGGAISAGHESHSADALSGPKAPIYQRPWFSGLAAALVLASAAGGFLVGRQTTTSNVTPVAAQPPAVSVQATPPELLIPAPSPTRVIHLQAGKDWTERAGGN